MLCHHPTEPSPFFIFLVDLYEMDVTYIYSRPTDVGQLGIYGKSIRFSIELYLLLACNGIGAHCLEWVGVRVGVLTV